MNATGERMEKYGTVLFGGLVLFSLSLALSKSATNVLMALIYLAVLFLAARYQSFRSIVMRNARQPLLLPLFLYLSAAGPGPWSIDALRHAKGRA